MTISPEFVKVASDATNTTFAVTSNTKWTVSTTSDWATVATTSGENNGEVKITFSENSTDTERTADIVVTTEDRSITKTFKLTQNGVGDAEPKSYEWDLTSVSNDWTANGCVSYFAQPYGIKKANAYIVNKSISDFANASKISVSVKSLCNGATTSKLTVYLVDATGKAIGDGQVIIPDDISNASKTTYKEVIFNSVDSKVTGLMIKCTTFGKNVLINGVKYTVNY